MKFMNKIRSLGRKGKVAAVVLVALSAGVAVPMVHAEFYPARPTFDYNKYDPNNLNCDDANNPAAQNGRCGSMNGPVFNSFINTPSYGDERAFLDGRNADAAPSTTSDNTTNVNKGAKEVILRLYVHNNANQDTNASGKGIAHNTNVRIALPTATENVLRARGYISASNAALVEDTTDLSGTDKFNVSYVPGSAKLLRGTASYALSDSIVTTGAPIGDSVMNGDLPGCFDYAALVEVHIKINPAPTPALQVTKEVKVKGATGWNKEISTKPGTEIQFRLGSKDISNANLDNVVLRDVLPPHVKIVPGSVRLITPAKDQVVADGPLFAGGYNVGNFVPGSVEYVIFNTTVLDDFPTCETRIRNIVHGRSDQTPTEQTDTSDVIITKENCNTTATPAYACNSLTATAGDNRTTTFNTTASATGGATIALYQYNFGDNTPVMTTDKPSVTHTYAKDGNYAARVKVQFAVAGGTKYDEGDKCAVTTSYTTPPKPGTPVATVSRPTTLVNTGAGSVAGLFAVVTIAGALGRSWFLGRRFNG